MAAAQTALDHFFNLSSSIISMVPTIYNISFQIYQRFQGYMSKYLSVY